MGGFLAEVAERFAEHEALVFEGERITYRELYERSTRFAVDPGERVAIVMGNRPDAVAALFGVTMAGGVAVPLSTFATRDELAFMLDDAGIERVITQPRLL